MKRLIMFWRIILAGGHNFLRNAWLSMAATVVMVITLTVMLSAIILNLALKDTLAQVTNRIDVAIFLEDTAKEAQIEALTTRLQQLENVQNTRFVSKSAALERYQEQNRDNPQLLEAVTAAENPLPPSIEVQVKDLKLIDSVIAVTEEPDFAPLVQDTSYGEDRQRTIQRIAGINNFLTNAGIVSAFVFTTIAVLIIFNTIRMAIFSRQEEVQIMRLIGATNWYIRGPFLFEAMLGGIIAALISIGIVFTTLYTGGPQLLSYISFANTLAIFQSSGIWVGLATILAGVAIGTFSSMLAMVRYLKL